MLSVLFWIAQIACSLKVLHMLQMNGYRPVPGRRYFFLWLTSDALCLIGVFVLFLEGWGGTVTLLVSLALLVLTVAFRPRKTPLRFTRRILRNLAVFAGLSAALTAAVTVLAPDWLLLTGLLNLPLALLSWALLLPVERMIRNRFLVRAREKLARCSCLVVGITGSFGKTTTKNFLYDLLKDSFRTVKTPASYNTELGIARSVLEEVREDTEIFLCEMGARHVGDIDALCRIAPPDYGIVTSVGSCHLRTFRSLERVREAKSELCRHTRVFCAVGDSETTRELYLAAPCDKSLVSPEPVGVDSFYLELGGKREFFRSNLPGSAVQKDLALALTVAHRLGVDTETLRRRCLSLTPVEHRCQIIRNGGVTIVDDSYNSNASGAENMLEVVSGLPGRKMLVTCGMVELGRLQYRQNFEFAAKCGGFERIFVVSRTNRRAILDGLASIGYPAERIKCCKRLGEVREQLKKIVRPGDVVVFENDLPDSYI